MKIVRLSDNNIEDLINLTRAQVVETLPHLRYDEYLTRNNARYVVENPDYQVRVYIAYDDSGEAVGYLVLNVYQYLFMDAVHIGQEVVYVLPEHRGGRAFSMLMRVLDDVAKEVGAQEIYVGVANGRKMDSFDRWCGKNGYKKVGTYARKIL